MSSSVVDYGGKTEKYSWIQGEEDVTITVSLPAGTRGKDIQCLIKSNSIKLNYKASPAPIIDGEFVYPVVVDESTWSIDEKGCVEIYLKKQITQDEKQKWWKSAIKGDSEIDTELIEASKYLDESLLRKMKEGKSRQAAEDKQ